MAAFHEINEICTGAKAKNKTLETIELYNKEITYTELDKYHTKTFCLPKLFRDADKPDPMTERMEDLKNMLKDELNETIRAYWIWASNKTEANANALLEELADVKNIANFMSGQVAGFTKMKRE